MVRVNMWKLAQKMKRYKRRYAINKVNLHDPKPHMDVERLSYAGKISTPDWLPVVKMISPRAAPPQNSQPVKKLTYLEDRLREAFFEKFPEAEFAPVNARARHMTRRHISDRFVYEQMILMENGLTEEQAFDLLAVKMRDIIEQELGNQKDLYARLSLARVKNYYAKVFLASWSDSSRDKFIYENMAGAKPKGRFITLDDILSPDFTPTKPANAEENDGASDTSDSPDTQK
mmetsp:Transcript_12030/g.36676  ORF Transcript_12030/g.36676 Transcript_12030/m.36676 type:complete len:231 (+) Transcript_12030:127-819(+)